MKKETCLTLKAAKDLMHRFNLTAAAPSMREMSSGKAVYISDNRSYVVFYRVGHPGFAVALKDLK